MGVKIEGKKNNKSVPSTQGHRAPQEEIPPQIYQYISHPLHHIKKVPQMMSKKFDKKNGRHARKTLASHCSERSSERVIIDVSSSKQLETD